MNFRFAEDESDPQRQSRLIAQALITVEKVLKTNKQLENEICEIFHFPATINALMNLQANVCIY